jgi:hypothetical protein
MAIINVKIEELDKKKFKEKAKELCLTLSGFMKLSASEKSKKMEESQK